MNQSKAVVPYLRQFNDEEKKLLAVLVAQVAPKATNGEKALFLYTAQKKGLDPFDKQIYLVPRYSSDGLKHSVQVSIDGLRLMAQRSGKYAGQTPYQWCGPDGKWVDVWLSEEHPVAARAGILRHDFKEPLHSVALWKSYKQTKKDGSLNTFWEKYDAHMLAKCAEALSIRRAFPEETSGYYIPEEMGNPELVYVAEAEQDDAAPIAESEIVEDATPATRQNAPGNGHQPQASAPVEGKAQPAPVQDVLVGKEKVISLYNYAYKLGLFASLQEWQQFKSEHLGQMVSDEKVSQIQYDVLVAELAKRKEAATSGK